MKLRNLLLSGLAALSLTAFAQTHEQGIEYYKAEQLYNAQELLNRNLNNPGTDKALSYYYLGQIAIQKDKNVAQAKKYFNDGIAADAENPYNYIGLGYLALKDGDVKTAEKYFKDAESRAKKDQTVQVEIARAYYEADPVKYQAVYEKKIANALKKDAKNPDIYIFQGDVLRDNAYSTGDSKQYGQAAAKYDMATSNDQSSAVAYVKYADMYKNANNKPFAVTKLEELIRNNPTSALGQRELAKAYYDNGQFDKAAEQYGNYVKNPNHFKSDEVQYAVILFGAGRYQDGYNYASELLRENPDDFSAMRFQFMNAAQIPSMQGTLLPLAEKLLAAHRSNPDNKFAQIDYRLIASELDTDKRPEDAIALLKEATEVFPADADFYKQMAEIYVDGNDMISAVDALDNYLAKTSNPGLNDYLMTSVYALYAARQNLDNAEVAGTYFSKATDYAQKAKEKAPNHYRPVQILGDIAKFSAKTPEEQQSVAVPIYENAIALMEANPGSMVPAQATDMYTYVGNYYYTQKDNAKAKDYYKKALDLNPDNTALQDFYNTLK